MCTQKELLKSVKRSLPPRVNMNDAERLINQISYFAVTGRAESTAVPHVRSSQTSVKRRLASRKKR